jgi:hypothetical protein
MSVMFNVEERETGRRGMKKGRTNKMGGKVIKGKVP